MAEGILASLSVRLGAEITDFQRGMATARKDLAGFVKAGEAMKDIGSNLSLYVSAPLVAFGGLAVKVSGDFEAGMNRVKAATQAVGPEFEALRNKAKELGANTKFSSTEAAQGLETLAKNGLNTAQILGGGIDASLALAAATGGTLATAADIATDVMNNFGKTAADLPSLVDGITGSTIASKFGIDDYRYALGAAGAVAGQAGISFQDFNTAIAATSSGFASGSDAGTSFKTFIQRLVPQSAEAAQAMKNLGLNFFDAQGKMKPLREIAEQLQNTLGRLSDKQKNAYGTQIFGSDSIRTALLLANQGAEGFDKMAESIAKVDAAAQAKTLTQGFNGALEEFKSGFEGFQIQLGESGILDFATGFLRAGTDAIRGLANLNPEILKFGSIIAGAVAAIGPLTFAIGSVLSAMPTLTAGFAALTGPIGLTVAAIAGAAILIISNWDTIKEYFASSGLGAVFSQMAETVGGAVSAMVSYIKDFAALLAPIAGFVVKLFAGPVVETFKFLFTTIGAGFEVVKRIFMAFGALVRGDWEGLWLGLGNIVISVLNGITKILTGFFSGSIRIFKGIANAVGNKQLADSFESGAASVDKFGKSLLKAYLGTEKVAASAKQATTALIPEIPKTELPKITAPDLGAGGKGDKLKLEKVAEIKLIYHLETSGFKKEIADIEKNNDEVGNNKGYEVPIKLSLPQNVAEEFSRFKDGVREGMTNLNGVVVEMAGLVQGSLGSVVNLIGETLGQAFSGNFEGIKGFFNSFLNIVFDFAAQLGKTMVALGLARISLANIGISGIGAVIAGTALIALAGAAKAMFAKGPSVGGAGAAVPSGGAGMSNSNGLNPRSNAAAFTSARNEQETEQTIRIEGSTLIAVLRKTSQSAARTYSAG